MPKPCDTHASQLPCANFGKCYGYATWAGKSGTAKKLVEVQECPYHQEVRDWWRKGGGMK